MTVVKRWALMLAALGLLSACSTRSLEELRQTTPKGNAFQNALSQHYLKFAEDKERQYDWYSVAHFADKGLLAAYGNEIGPESLDNWDLPDERRTELEKARADLLAVLTPGVIESQAEMAALAQFSFDCWVNYADPNWQMDRIYDCREAFLDAMYELAPPEADKFRDHYTVYFQWGEASITAQAQEIIDGVVSLLEPLAAYEVVLSGHTDLSGGSKFNLMLAQKRVEAVKARLVAGGVREESILSTAYGESDPLVQGKAGQRSAQNRRVEIVLGEK